MNKLGVSWANLNCVKTHENYIGSVKDEILLILTNVAMTYMGHRDQDGKKVDEMSLFFLK